MGRREKDISATLDIATQTAKVMATVRGKCLVNKLLIKRCINMSFVNEAYCWSVAICF